MENVILKVGRVVALANGWMILIGFEGFLRAGLWWLEALLDLIVILLSLRVILDSLSGKDTTAERFQFEEHVSPEWEAERERRAKFRKMYRWERYQFGRFALEAQAFELLKTDIHPSTHLLTKQERRDKIGDSLFKEERRSNVCYIDAKDVEIDKQVLPIITSSNYFKVVTSEPPQKTTSIEQGIVKSDKAESETPSVKKSPASVVKVESEEVNTKGKKDKKKKKRRSSSSSDDLEELERKSEARLGIRVVLVAI
ncbi:hypothetical protein GE061_007880 [Apolygus lucorum]|uniref:Uncharacterized protein n=1 Tax=Apolygus lucorum TaxID=248454 RepID=A0A8S9WN49_APOLU|nr:hypothetical protein GE061_007880 [Apolygus lucorum]